MDERGDDCQERRRERAALMNNDRATDEDDRRGQGRMGEAVVSREPIGVPCDAERGS
jgi:hypothetical protein